MSYNWSFQILRSLDLSLVIGDRIALEGTKQCQKLALHHLSMM